MALGDTIERLIEEAAEQVPCLGESSVGVSVARRSAGWYWSVHFDMSAEPGLMARGVIGLDGGFAAVQGLCRFGDETGRSGPLVFWAAFRWATKLAYIGALLEFLRLSAVVIPFVRSMIRLVRREGRPRRGLT